MRAILEQYLKRTSGGLILRNYIRHFTPDLFTWENDHNPLIASHCSQCEGKGFYRTGLGRSRHDKTCEQCQGVGGFEQAEPFFGKSRIRRLSPNKAGFAICPACAQSFPVQSNQFWTGLRHRCGQKIELFGSFSDLCWRQAYDEERGITRKTSRGLTVTIRRMFGL